MSHINALEFGKDSLSYKVTFMLSSKKAFVCLYRIIVFYFNIN